MTDLLTRQATALALPAPRTPNPGPGGAVVIHPGGRRWPVDRFAALARRLRPAGTVVLTGHAAEWPVALAVAAEAGLRPDQVLAGRTTADELAALVSCAALVVTGAPLVADLAAAHGSPSVVLGGPPGRRPPGPHRAVVHRGDPDGATIGVEEVLEACVAVL
jgi:ADP-heptose:LPS heptosyltransferase